MESDTLSSVREDCTLPLSGYHNPNWVEVRLITDGQRQRQEVGDLLVKRASAIPSEASAPPLKNSIYIWRWKLVVGIILSSTSAALTRVTASLGLKTPLVKQLVSLLRIVWLDQVFTNSTRHAAARFWVEA